MFGCRQLHETPAFRRPAQSKSLGTAISRFPTDTSCVALASIDSALGADCALGIGCLWLCAGTTSVAVMANSLAQMAAAFKSSGWASMAACRMFSATPMSADPRRTVRRPFPRVASVSLEEDTSTMTTSAFVLPAGPCAHMPASSTCAPRTPSHGPSCWQVAQREWSGLHYPM